MSRTVPADRPTPLTVLCGLDRSVVADIAAGLMLRVPRLAQIWVDPATADLGYVECRVTDSDGRCTTRTFELEHRCLSCTMRRTVATVVRRLRATGRYDSILVRLHPGVEASAAVSTMVTDLDGEAYVDAVVLPLQPDWLDVLDGAEDLTARGIAVVPGDDRPVAQVLAADLDVATVLVLGGVPARGNALDAHAVLGALSPDSTRVYPPTALDVEPGTVLRTHAFAPEVLHPLTRGGLLGARSALVTSRGPLTLVRWRADLPLHPQRLHDALPDLAVGVFRSAGRLWFAHHPDLLVGWDSAGSSLSLGPECSWPGPPFDPSAPRLRDAGRPAPHRARENVLAFLGRGLDGDRIHGVLDRCVLTAAEFAAGPELWASWPEPFPDWRSAGNDAGAA